MLKVKLIFLFVLIKLVISNDQLINFVPDTDDFDLMASESINDQYSQLVVDLTTEDYLKECVEAHNEKRKIHRVDPLVYDEKLLNDAKEAAFQSAVNGRLTRIDDSPYGENLAASTKRLTCNNAVSLWYRQNSLYNYHVPLYNKNSGGFTQLVWRDTKRFACAQARHKNNTARYFTVCVYDPFGNVSGQFRANVLPPIDKSAEFSNNSSSFPTNQTTPHVVTTTLKSTSISTTSKSFNNTTEAEPLHETTLNVSPQDPNYSNESPPTNMVKPILNKARLSPGMLVKLKNLNRQKSVVPNGRNFLKTNENDNLEASASELNMFLQLNTISPTLNLYDVSNLMKRNQTRELNAVSSETATPLVNNNEDLSYTTVRSL